MHILFSIESEGDGETVQSSTSESSEYTSLDFTQNNAVPWPVSDPIPIPRASQQYRQRR